MADATDLPNIGLLIKLLKLTTSSNDQEALSAIRKANEQLAKFGGDWEKLLRGKVTIISDPFANSAPPASHEVKSNGRAPSVPQPPTQQQRFQWTATNPKPYPQSTVRVTPRRRPRSTGLDSLA